MNYAMCILGLLVGAVLLAFSTKANQLDEHDRALALPTTLTVLTIGDKVWECVEWAGAGG